MWQPGYGPGVITDRPLRVHVDPREYTSPPREYIDPNREYIGPQREYIGPPREYIGPPREYTGPPREYIGPPRGYIGPSPPREIIDPRVYGGPPIHHAAHLHQPSGRRHKSVERQRSSKRSDSKKPAEDSLKQWSAWRTGINNELGRDLVRNTYKPIPVGQEFDDLVQPSSRSKRGVYNYSSAIDQATRLHKEDYVNFGIPRAQIAKSSPKPEMPGYVSDSETETERPFYSINKLTDQSRINGVQQLSNAVYQDRNGHSHRERDGKRQNRHRHIEPDIEIDHRRGRSYR